MLVIYNGDFLLVVKLHCYINIQVTVGIYNKAF